MYLCFLSREDLMNVLVLPHERQTPGIFIVAIESWELKLRVSGWQLRVCVEPLSSFYPHSVSGSNYTALVGVWIYGFFVVVLLALDFLYYSAINYELCRVYLEKWGLGGRWLKKARSQWHKSMSEESEAQAQAQPMVPSHYQPRHSLRGESHSPTLLPYNTSTAWWVTVCLMIRLEHMFTVKLQKTEISEVRFTSQISWVTTTVS